MKKLSCILIFIVLLMIFISPKENMYDYLRLHIRANSNAAVDQNVKYEIKTEVVKYLTPFLQNVSCKEDAIMVINENVDEIEFICDLKLQNYGFNYRSNVKINNEYFPTRTYENTTLNSGYYDAVIIELGEAEGDNWWCVMYPPLCFVNKNENNKQIKYKSRIVEWFKKVFY